MAGNYFKRKALENNTRETNRYTDQIKEMAMYWEQFKDDGRLYTV
jgi:hypothetical protein